MDHAPSSFHLLPLFFSSPERERVKLAVSLAVLLIFLIEIFLNTGAARDLCARVHCCLIAFIRNLNEGHVWIT